MFSTDITLQITLRPRDLVPLPIAFPPYQKQAPVKCFKWKSEAVSILENQVELKQWGCEKLFEKMF